MKSYPGWHKLMQTRVSGDTIVPRVEDYQDGGMWDKICTSLTGLHLDQVTGRQQLTLGFGTKYPCSPFLVSPGISSGMRQVTTVKWFGRQHLGSDVG